MLTERASDGPVEVKMDLEGELPERGGEHQTGGTGDHLGRRAPGGLGPEAVHVRRLGEASETRGTIDTAVVNSG